IDQTATNVLLAHDEHGSLRYEFGPEAITLNATNFSSTEPLGFCVVFSPAIVAVTNESGEWARTPAQRDWLVTSWFAGPVKLSLSGGVRIRGLSGEQSGQQLQIWDGQLAPGKSRTVVLRIAETTPAEAAKVAAVVGGPATAEQDLAVT